MSATVCGREGGREGGEGRRGGSEGVGRERGREEKEGREERNIQKVVGMFMDK